MSCIGPSLDSQKRVSMEKAPISTSRLLEILIKSLVHPLRTFFIHGNLLPRPTGVLLSSVFRAFFTLHLAYDQ